MGAVAPVVGLAVGLAAGGLGAYQAKRQSDYMKDQTKKANARQLALEARASNNEKRATALNDANLLRQRQRALAAGVPSSPTSKTGASGVLGSAPLAGKTLLGA